MSLHSVSALAGVNYLTVLPDVGEFASVPTAKARVLHQTELPADSSHKWGSQAGCTDAQRAASSEDPMTLLSLIIH